MEHTTEADITLFDTLLNETEPGMSILLMELLDLHGGVVGVVEQEYTGPDRRSTAA